MSQHRTLGTAIKGQISFKMQIREINFDLASDYATNMMTQEVRDYRLKHPRSMPNTSTQSLDSVITCTSGHRHEWPPFL